MTEHGQKLMKWLGQAFDHAQRFSIGEPANLTQQVRERIEQLEKELLDSVVVQKNAGTEEELRLVRAASERTLAGYLERIGRLEGDAVLWRKALALAADELADDKRQTEHRQAMIKHLRELAQAGVKQ